PAVPNLHYYCRRANETRDQVVGIYDLTYLPQVVADCPTLVEQLKSKKPEWKGGVENAVQYYIKNQNCN
ncbi:MAG: hypothetical protein H0X46_07385, partial [Bacteroidetes bacterium]|nr:hypothetical protein [Bacteroidota bacterium]